MDVRLLPEPSKQGVHQASEPFGGSCEQSVLEFPADVLVVLLNSHESQSSNVILTVFTHLRSEDQFVYGLEQVLECYLSFILLFLILLSRNTIYIGLLAS